MSARYLARGPAACYTNRMDKQLLRWMNAMEMALGAQIDESGCKDAALHLRKASTISMAMEKSSSDASANCAPLSGQPDAPPLRAPTLAPTCASIRAALVFEIAEDLMQVVQDRRASLTTQEQVSFADAFESAARYIRRKWGAQ